MYLGLFGVMWGSIEPYRVISRLGSRNLAGIARGFWAVPIQGSMGRNSTASLCPSILDVGCTFA